MPKRSQKKAAARAESVPDAVPALLAFLNKPDHTPAALTEHAYWLDYFRCAAAAEGANAQHRAVVNAMISNARYPFVDTEHPFARQCLAENLAQLGRLADLAAERKPIAGVWPGRVYDHTRTEAALWLVTSGRFRDLRACSECGTWYLARHDAMRQCSRACERAKARNYVRAHRETLAKLSGRKARNP
jgi:hypothetical protein